MPVRSVALVGVVGGAGTTRTAIELAGALAQSGRSALVFDLDFATQGLAHHVEGRIDVDAVALLADTEPGLAEAVREWEVPGPGRLGVVPAYAPFTEIATGKAREAAMRVEGRIDEAAADFDHVLLDVPPVVSNQAVAGVTAADRVVAVVPPTDRGTDALQRERGRLADVGAVLDGAVAVGASDGDEVPDADWTLPALPAGAPERRPATVHGGGAFTDAVATLAEALFDVSLDIDNQDRGASTLDRLRGRLP
ncbi:MAG: ParA family protein [Halodesulfurarchaeum sp.]